MSELRNQVEALLFSSGRAMTVEDISNVMNIEKKEIKKALKELKDHYDSLDSSLMVTQEGDSWKLNIREKHVSLVTKIVADTELRKTVLETLSVIAWKSPVLQSEVIKIRTNKAYDHIRELVEADFITKEKEGRSYRLRISEKFFEYFDVSGDKGIKEAFKDVRIPEKKEPEKLGNLEVVPVEGNTEEHGKTAEIFGDKKEEAKPDKESDEETQEEEKEDIPPVDEKFLDNINKQIEEIAQKNDELDEDELFKRRKEEQESDEEKQKELEEDGVSEEEKSDEREDSEEKEEFVDESGEADRESAGKRVKDASS